MFTQNLEYKDALVFYIEIIFILLVIYVIKWIKLLV